ncbi:DEAD/DEAH box helicase [Gimesia sp.]|uniref:DEAD/DEAH box helicase n=1 Tax=Gimesia sp. TaxID=2024833 RepID=UPI003A9336E8
MAKTGRSTGGPADSAGVNLQNPLALRAIDCPNCKRKYLIHSDDLSRYARCVCNKRFQAARHIVADEVTSMDSCYADWQCPKCARTLLLPRFAVILPGKCPCGNEYPTASQVGPSRYLLDEVNDAFVGNDPLISENMLMSLRAAQRYDYEVTNEGGSLYRVRNPKKGTIYKVKLSPDYFDKCDCEIFQSEARTCIHIEHVRIKEKLPSTAQVIAESQEYAYVWLDKSSLPVRIRIGWVGDIGNDVRKIVQNHGAITTSADLESLSSEFQKAGISFHTMPSASLSLSRDSEVSIDIDLAKRISVHGRTFLAKHFPKLHQFQVEGGLFLSSAQRALLLDEMGLGKTVQAIAAAFILREFANITSCLILAPKSVLRHWQSEIRRFASMECTIIEGPPEIRADLYDDKAFFKVTTLESFRRDYPEVGCHDLVIVDEIQKARSVKSVSNRVLRALESRFLFGLSGTAIESSLEDLYGLLRIIRSPDLELPLHFYASHLICDSFGKAHHTLHPEFFYIRHSDRILRRCKSETNTKIPSIHIEQVDLELSSPQEIMAEPLLAELSQLKERLIKRHNHNDFIRHRWLVNRIVELSNSTELLDKRTKASSKLEWLKEFLLSECVKADEKVVVFTRWVRSQKMILRVCNELGLKTVSLNGQNSAVEREEAIRSFTTDRDIQVFVSTDAGGVGVNLQVARVLVNFEPAWNPSTDAQRIQRVHRIGQHRKVRAIMPLTILDHIFTLSTHPRKSFASDSIDADRKMATGESFQSWEELLPVIERLRRKNEKTFQC